MPRAVLPSALIDTGAFLALLDRGDRWHEACVSAFASLHPPLATSAAVLAELFHLVGDDRRRVAAAWKLVRCGAFTVAPISDGDLPEIDRLMERYADTPMDFADATIVHLARRESLTAILTTDNSDFEVYRIDGRRPFRILPGRTPGKR